MQERKEKLLTGEAIKITGTESSEKKVSVLTSGFSVELKTDLAPK